MKCTILSLGQDLFLGVMRCAVRVECTCGCNTKDYYRFIAFDEKNKPTPQQLEDFVRNCQEEAQMDFYDEFFGEGMDEEVAPQPVTPVETTPAPVETATAVTPEEPTADAVEPEPAVELFNVDTLPHVECLRKIVAEKLGPDWRTKNANKLKVNEIVAKLKGKVPFDAAFEETVKGMLE